MNRNSKVYQEDMEYIAYSTSIDWRYLQGKTIFVTGGTGLIGSTLIQGLLFANHKCHLNLKIIALVRDLERAKKLFEGGDENCDGLQFLEGTVEALPHVSDTVDYIIHGASPTASLYFVQHPVETIKTAVQGTQNLLDLGMEKKVSGFVYLSSMEVYGAPLSDDFILESQGCTLDSMTVRSCYPIAKRLCENLCASYASEYEVPSKVVRLAQTFGPGVSIQDNRVFAEFARDAIHGADIKLQTAGTSKRMYLYTADAVTAILTVLLSGKSGEAYNAANPETYCSIVEMAQFVAHDIGKDQIQVHLPSTKVDADSKFPPPHHLKLDTNKISELGWKPSRGLKEMYLRMIEDMI